MNSKARNKCTDTSGDVKFSSKIESASYNAISDSMSFKKGDTVTMTYNVPNTNITSTVSMAISQSNIKGYTAAGKWNPKI